MNTHPDARILVHRQPVWAERADQQIDLVIPDGDGDLERLAARRLGSGLYEVCCLPFALYDFSLGDTIKVRDLTPDSPGHVERTVASSGRFAFRIILNDGGAGTV